MTVESKLMLEVKAILKSFGDKYFHGDKLKRHKVIEDLTSYDEKLIQSLLNNETINRDFVISINGKEIFKLNEFIDMFQYKEFWQDSYTNYANKIGLTVGGKFIDECEDVVLDFPYKDTVLKAGMTKQDKQKEDLAPNEMFLNEIIAKDEIDVLFDKKIFKNVKKYSVEGVQPVSKFKEDDNLIIKGNNLIALHSLKDKYAGKVKLIYIDPPYNTGSDSFLYNDKYNHSSWLIFMKNRLKIARDLLSDDGSIFIQCDDFEDSYLKVLMDEIFGRDNYRNKITWKRRGGSANPKNRLNNVTDYIIWYSKTDMMDYHPIFTLNDEKTQKYITERFKFTDENGRRFMKSPLQSPNLRPNLMYEYKGYKVPAKGWSISKEIMEQWDKEGRLCFPQDKTQNINRKIFLDEYKGQPISALWSDINVINPMSKEAIDFTGQKPEALIKRILEMCTHENELVLDFHLGTGTTAATAIKMNRRFIGIEQMDYISSITINRLLSVLKGEQCGISKDVNWQGGGSFIYAELFEKNDGFIKDILNAKTIDDLKKVYNIMIEVGDLDFRADLSKIDWTMPFEDNQKLLIKIIDKNQLYFNYSEIDDSEVREYLTDDEVSFNKNFYEDLEG